MPPNYRLDRQLTEDVRRQLAVQLQVDNAHLASIPAEGLHRLREQLNVDELTGVLTRRAGMTALDEAIGRVRLSGASELAVAFLDVDGLKAINDTGGHARGDLMLMALADVLKATLREDDIVFRYGGDEFVCAMPLTSVAVAGGLMREAWCALHGLGWCSFSAGFADLREDDDGSSVVARADQCLYAGRRRTQRRDWRIAT
jgi:diguanylate cyclase (GGDEF)-like protein